MDLSSPDTLSNTPNQLRLLRHLCEQDFLAFSRFVFRIRESQKFIVSEHHRLICKALESVVKGDIKRLIINIPPGYTKTELAVISFISWGLALNPQAKFMHLSFSDDLAMENSQKIRDVILSPEFQALWPMQLRADSKAKKKWWTNQGGGLMAAPTGGTVTGFRAGRMQPGTFTGALVIDDPIKPDDAYSDTTRTRVNNRIPNTVKSRVAIESETPIIVIGQRVHEEDTTGFLLKGGSGDKWHHLCIPVEVPDTSRPYPREYTHGIEMSLDGLESGPLWPLKHDVDDLEVIKADPYTYASQYMQEPAPIGGGMFKQEWWQYYQRYDSARNQLYINEEQEAKGVGINIRHKIIYADTAQKTGEHNDWSVFQCWGFGADRRIYLLDQVRGKWESPDLRVKLMAFMDRHKYKKGVNMIGLRDTKVEDKSSGSGLIQEIRRHQGYIIHGIPRDKDKVSRAFGCIPQIAQGRVVLPKHAMWLSDYLHEFSRFTPMMTHAHDDQIDPTLDAIQDNLISTGGMCYKDIV